MYDQNDHIDRNKSIDDLNGFDARLTAQYIPEAPEVPGAHAIPGLTFRHFRDTSDYQQMAQVLNVSRRADGFPWGDETPEGLQRTYATTTTFNSERDILLAEVAGTGTLIGYNRVLWTSLDDGTYFYRHVGFIIPSC